MDTKLELEGREGLKANKNFFMNQLKLLKALVICV